MLVTVCDLRGEAVCVSEPVFCPLEWESDCVKNECCEGIKICDVSIKGGGMGWWEVLPVATVTGVLDMACCITDVESLCLDYKNIQEFTRM